MAVNSVAATSVSAIPSSVSTQQTTPRNDKQVEKQQDSTVVKLSAQAQQLNRNADTVRAPQQEVVAPASVPVNQSASKGANVNTYA